MVLPTFLTSFLERDNLPKGEAVEFYEDDGFIILPDEYSESGAPTRLVISCHGAGGTVTTDDSQVEHQAMTEYLVANGYAVMDVNGLPQKYATEREIDIRNNIGSPIAIRSYVKAYHYCMEHFNLRPEVFVHGGSMGGISSTNLVLCGCIPVPENYQGVANIRRGDNKTIIIEGKDGSSVTVPCDVDYLK